jgi:hypothetical protein
VPLIRLAGADLADTNDEWTADVATAPEPSAASPRASGHAEAAAQTGGGQQAPGITLQGPTTRRGAIMVGITGAVEQAAVAEAVFGQ